MSMTANETIIHSGTGFSESVIAVVLDEDLVEHRAIWVGGTGDVAVVLADDSAVTITGVQAGSLLPLRAKQVATIGTTATGLLLWI